MTETKPRLICTKCGFTYFQVRWREGVEAVTARSELLFGLIPEREAVAAVPRRIEATCLRCFEVHVVGPDHAHIAYEIGNPDHEPWPMPRRPDPRLSSPAEQLEEIKALRQENRDLREVMYEAGVDLIRRSDFQNMQLVSSKLCAFARIPWPKMREVERPASPTEVKGG